MNRLPHKPAAIIKTILYYSLVVIAGIIAFYIITFNGKEVIQRYNGETTVLAQVSWLTDNQAILLCTTELFLMAGLLFLATRYITRNNKKAAVVVCSTIVLLFPLLLYIESFFYNNNS